MLVAFSSRRPVVLILDDLQWADELTLSFVCEHLGDDFFAGHAVLIAATCRDEELPPELRRSLRRPQRRAPVAAPARHQRRRPG